MKQQVTDANFPKTSEGRVYHLGLRSGELANRIITVGDPARARTIAKYFDQSSTKASGGGIEHESSDAYIHPNGDAAHCDSMFELHSERGFLTLTGMYKGVRLSIVAIGMGAPNMDFFVREGREVLDEEGQGDMIIIRFGSCGGLASLPVGSLTVPKASINVSRNYDFDFVRSEETEESTDNFLSAYRISKPAYADAKLHDLLLSTLRSQLPESTVVSGDHLNASADSFYSSQGRVTSFPDHNRGLIDHLVEKQVGSLEMETFHLLHLANNWPRSSRTTQNRSGIPGSKGISDPPPPTTPPTIPTPQEQEEEETILYPSPHSQQHSTDNASDHTEPENVSDAPPSRTIRAAAVQMIFADRASRAFITPEEVEALQEATAKGLLETLVQWKDGGE